MTSQFHACSFVHLNALIWNHKTVLHVTRPYYNSLGMRLGTIVKQNSRGSAHEIIVTISGHVFAIHKPWNHLSTKTVGGSARDDLRCSCLSLFDHEP